MNNIILKDLLDVISEYDIVKIYIERENKFQYLTTANPRDILEDDEEEYLLDSDLRVTGVSMMYDDIYWRLVIEIVVKDIGNENE